MMTETLIALSLEKLLAYCESKDWRGYDPYDGLNSRLIQATPLMKSRAGRLAVVQLLKRAPVNPRQILLIDKGYNPKALGLFVSSYAKLYALKNNPNYADRIAYLKQLLDEQTIAGYSGSCWGYNFGWESRTHYVPLGTPNVVCTSFICNGLLDAYDVLGGPDYLETARSACDFILQDLNRTEENGGVCFSYTPIDDVQVYNASLLAAGLLVRVYAATGEPKLLSEATKALRFACQRQNPDGSWFYSPLPWHRWIDNFHTGFNLVAIRDFGRYSGNDRFNDALVRGIAYYRDNMFTADGVPKYFDKNFYPVDIHSLSQAIVTFVKLQDFLEADLTKAKNVALWTIRNMQDRKGYFYFQKHRFYTIRIPYMRWSQAWMAYALSLLAAELRLDGQGVVKPSRRLEESA